MIDVEKMIIKKYPKLKNSRVIKGAISKFADSVVHEKQINEFIKKNRHLGSFEFIDEALQYLNFDFFVSDKDLQTFLPPDALSLLPIIRLVLWMHSHLSNLSVISEKI
ncbi:hypothetical protein [Sulfurimonas sp. NW9]|uniref:hypothetical protein n=1 Tax=Sulfurimonas sp. NW9 TaxID=2922728 RepID=UPI003DA803B2